MMNITSRSDTLRRWPVEPLPRFELDEENDDDVPTLRVPELPQTQPNIPPKVPEPSTAPVTNTLTYSKAHEWAASTARLVLERVVRIRRSFNPALAEVTVSKVRDLLCAAREQWTRVRLELSRYGGNRTRWLATAVVACSFSALEFLGAPTHANVAHTRQASTTPVIASARLEAQLAPIATEQRPLPVESLPLAKAPSPSMARTNASAISHSATRVATIQSLLKRPFDSEAAGKALDTAASNTRRCTRNQMAGTVMVSFEPSGKVSDVTLGTLAGDVIQIACVVQTFRNVRVPPFAGHGVHVRKTFAVSR